VKVAVAAEVVEGERRVAAVPDTVRRLVASGGEVGVESGLGWYVFAPDDAYAAAGAVVSPAGDVGQLLATADVLAAVRAPAPSRLAALRPGSVAVGLFSPSAEPEAVRAARDGGITLMSLELLPRISRAQAMDALSSQALVAGYRAVLVAAERLPRFLPLFMTAAGTVPPARFLILGAGVAGLQAVATARRLGAVVEAYDVRAASAEEVRSLGATFVDLGLDALEGAGGYAREMGKDRAVRQRELLTPYVARADAVITTAAVPGRPAPLLVTADMVTAMRPGSIVVDLAAESGGNCELSQPGAEEWHGDVLVWGGRDVPSQLPVHASALYASNVANLLGLLVHDGELRVDLSDEVVAGCCVTYGGEVVHAATAAELGDREEAR
jgi:proton-translocating NAD(P)+ transhydrogenase subunit alpha